MKNHGTVRDAYISVELRPDSIQRLRMGLQQTFENQGIQCEPSSPSAHVSIAYTRGEADIKAIEFIAQAIAQDDFEVHIIGFDLLKGQNTPYDYLAMAIEADGDFRNAVELVEGKMPTRQFEGGFKGHVSLLRFKKDSLETELIEDLMRELNASSGAAYALGKLMCLHGECVKAFHPDRQCFYEARFEKRTA